ncbi:hypothetical protein CgIS1_22400 [Frankia sp. CgS1]|nr:hypothetical protein CgIS1_22400 [Frankia sp. CgIS1]
MGFSAGPARDCPGCGLMLPEPPEQIPGQAAAASAGCWLLYTEMLGRSYNDPARYSSHQLLVDSYTAQHVDWSQPRRVQGLSICLMTLCLFLEDGADPREGPRLHRRMVARPVFHPLDLDPVLLHGRMTIADLAPADDAGEYETLLRAWAAQVWGAWAAHHTTIRGWIEEALP